MPDPLAAARARGARYQQQILRGPDMLTEHEVLELLSVTPAVLAHMRATHQVLALPDGSRFKYPIWQFDRRQRQVWPGLDQVLAVLKNPWRALRWLQKADPFLQDQQPVQALREGQIAAVLRAARWYGSDQGAT
jgi:hypothetical protein